MQIDSLILTGFISVCVAQDLSGFKPFCFKPAEAEGALLRANRLTPEQNWALERADLVMARVVAAS